MTQRSPKSGKGLQKEIHRGESMELAAIFGRHIGLDKCPNLNWIFLPYLVCHTDTLTSQTRLFQSINVIFCHFHEDFHWRMTPKSFKIEISPWYMLFMVPNVFPLNPGQRATYKKTQRSHTSVKGVRKEVHHSESLKLAAILDAILDFEKCSRMTSIHQADFVYVMSEAEESCEKKIDQSGQGILIWLPD